MSERVTVRLSDREKAGLVAAANRSGLPPATLAARFVVAGLAGPAEPVEPVDGPLVDTVGAAFDGLGGPAAAVRRELARSLARQVAAGGAGAASAARELDQLLVEAQDSRGAMGEFGAWLAEPEHTFCEGCRKPMTTEDRRVT